jgi:hypothetical protein
VDWPDELARDLPAPHEDEPASLRQDIIDELADHLACALRREQHRTADPQQAEQNVLGQFGDPARIARQLWLEAMQEKLMSQRLTLAFVAVIALASLAATGMAWQSVQQGREFNAAVLAKLETMAQAEPPISPDWNPTKVRLVLGEPDGSPAAGFQVNLSNLTDGLKYEEQTGADGIADFGLLRPGTYDVEALTPWQDRTFISLTVRPGRSLLKEIVCPQPPEMSEISLKINWPEDLRDRELFARCDFRPAPRSIQDQIIWYPPYSKQDLEKGVLADTAGNVVEMKFPLAYIDNTRASPDPPTPIHWESRTYLLHRLSVGSGRVWRADSKPPSKLSFLASVSYSTPPVPITRPSEGMTQGYTVGPDGMGRTVPLAAPELTARPDQPNVWKITLPDELVEAVRKSLAEQEAASE